jgi:transitional endoplasmic reticulum ATPase
MILEAFAEGVKREQIRKHWDNLDTKIEYAGRAITLPAEPGKMPLEKAVEALQRKIADEAQPFGVREVIDAYPHDGAVAFVKAMSKLYGWASPQTVMTFFGPKPPQMLSVRVGPRLEDVMQCPLGAFKLPGVEELVHTEFGYDAKNRPVFVVKATVKKRDRHILLELAEETRRIVKAESIYRGKPLRLGVTEDGDLDMSTPPEFIDVSDTTEASVLFDEGLMRQIDTNLLVPLKHTEACRALKIPLKRGVLLEGPFGTGKSLLARVAANVAERHGWTFILLDKVQGLRVALEFANRYAPAVVFAEDIDRILEDRDEDANDLINIIDGVLSKRAEVMTVLTTNHVDRINQVILRPGRLDAVISIRAPGPHTVQRLIRHYAGPILAVNENLEEAGTVLAGQIPATIRECVERAKLGMIGRGASEVVQTDIVTAAETMVTHLELLNRKRNEPTEAEKLASSLRAVLGGVDQVEADVEGAISPVSVQVAHVDARVRKVKELLDELVGHNAANGGAGSMISSQLDTILGGIKTIDKTTKDIKKSV